MIGRKQIYVIVISFVDKLGRIEFAFCKVKE